MGGHNQPHPRLRKSRRSISLKLGFHSTEDSPLRDKLLVSVQHGQSRGSSKLIFGSLRIRSSHQKTARRIKKAGPGNGRRADNGGKAIGGSTRAETVSTERSRSKARSRRTNTYDAHDAHFEEQAARHGPPNAKRDPARQGSLEANGSAPSLPTAYKRCGRGRRMGTCDERVSATCS